MDDNFNGRYILDEAGNVLPCPDLIEWGRWYETAGELRRVARDQVGDYLISTVFLALDHSWAPDPMRDPLTYRPVLWETMAFDCIGHSVCMHRYASREDALRGHAEVVKWVRRNLELQESQLKEALQKIGEEFGGIDALGPANDEEKHG